jgi:hypothetical protein
MRAPLPGKESAHALGRLTPSSLSTENEPTSLAIR